MSYFHFKKSAEEERQAMTTSVFKISRGDGGCFNPPCRQQPVALEAVFTRAPTLCTPLNRVSRPVDGFILGLIPNRSHGNRDRGLEQHTDDFGFVFYITSEESLMGEMNANPLRFLIISEVCAMGCNSENNQNRPQGHALLGFKGF